MSGQPLSNGKWSCWRFVCLDRANRHTTPARLVVMRESEIAARSQLSTHHGPARRL
ncbi:host cell division inhibitor Icd-like protein [Shigella flexneri]